MCLYNTNNNFIEYWINNLRKEDIALKNIIEKNKLFTIIFYIKVSISQFKDVGEEEKIFGDLNEKFLSWVINYI